MISRIHDLPIKTKIQLSLVSILIVVTSAIILFYMNDSRKIAMKASTNEVQNMTKMVTETTAYGLANLDFNHVIRAVKWIKMDERVLALNIYDQQNQLIAGFNDTQLSDNKLKECLFITKPMVKEDMIFVSMDIKNYDHVTESTKNLGKVLLGLSLKTLNQEIWENQKKSLVTAVFCLLVGILLAIKIANHISVPIAQLASVADKVGNDKDYAIRVPRQNNDEIGDLCDHFNDMLSKIQRQSVQMETLNESLERRVLDRTNELKVARDEAEHANNAKSHFLARMSHELRTPMNSILGFGQLMKLDKEGNLSDTQNGRLQEILKAGDYLLNLINEVLDLAKIESGSLTFNIEEIMLSDIVEETFSLIKPLTEKNNISFVNHLEREESISILADRTRIKQIFLNLFSNAVKYNIQNGNITVRAEVLHEDRVAIKITDTGLGIGKENIKKIFEPFHRLGAEFSDVDGVGIGLTITKQLLELMEGTIEVESSEGNGSTFTILLPKGPTMLKSTEVDVTELKESSTPETLSDQSKILYVEDNPANLKLMQQIFRQFSNIQLFSATEGETGIELARVHRPDLILMDIDLPGISGIEAFERLQDSEETRHIPVIGLSAGVQQKDIQACLDLGFKSYITKPISISKFLKEMKSILSEKNKKMEV